MLRIENTFFLRSKATLPFGQMLRGTQGNNTARSADLLSILGKQCAQRTLP
jgi:hypothetical protein